MLSQRQVSTIAERWGLGSDADVVGTASRGELGQVWRVVSSTGIWAVKEPFRLEPQDAILASAEFQEAAVAAGVPAPAVVRTVDGQVVVEVDGAQFRVYSWVDVRPLDLELDPVAVGTVLADIHKMAYPAVGEVDRWYTEPVGAARWDELVLGMNAAGTSLGVRLVELRDELCSLGSICERPSALAVQQLHLDLWADNLRATTSGELCVLDWDNCGPGHPGQELALVLVEYCSGSAARARSLYDAYLAAGGPGRVTGLGDFSMVVAQTGNILEWQCRNWLEATTSARREHAATEIEAYASRPLTMSMLSGILASVS